MLSWVYSEQQIPWFCGWIVSRFKIYILYRSTVTKKQIKVRVDWFRQNQAIPWNRVSLWWAGASSTLTFEPGQGNTLTDLNAWWKSTTQHHQSGLGSKGKTTPVTEWPAQEYRSNVGISLYLATKEGWTCVQQQVHITSIWWSLHINRQMV